MFRRSKNEPLAHPWRRRMLFRIALSALVFTSPSTSLPPLCLPASYVRSVLRLLCQNQVLRPFVRTDWHLDRNGARVLPSNRSWSSIIFLAVFPFCPPICQSRACSPKTAVRSCKFTHPRLMFSLLTSCSLVHMWAFLHFVGWLHRGGP